jgi:hypothetical protein
VSRTHDVTISAFDLDRLEAELEAERSLADRLANELLNTLSVWIIERDAEQAVKALAAWKEARSEIMPPRNSHKCCQSPTITK